MHDAAGPGSSRGGAEPPARLRARLHARLGCDAVHGLGLQAGARPGPARSRGTPDHGPAPGRPRPLWLLPEPAVLALDARGHPQCRGALELLDGPERMATGWRDGDDVERDYFVARNPEGSTLWIYRERRVPRMWYLQGLFG